MRVHNRLWALLVVWMVAVLGAPSANALTRNASSSTKVAFAVPKAAKNNAVPTVAVPRAAELGLAIGASPTSPFRLLMKRNGWVGVYDASRKAPLYQSFKITARRFGNPADQAPRDPGDRKALINAGYTQIGNAPDFHEDALLPAGVARATLKDFVGSGLHRSHGVANGDLPAFKDGRYRLQNEGTFALTNQVGHYPGVNTGPWNHMEKYYRNVVATKKDDVHIQIGHFYEGPQLEIDAQGVGRFGGIEVPHDPQSPMKYTISQSVRDEAWKQWAAQSSDPKIKFHQIGDRVLYREGRTFKFSEPGVKPDGMTQENTRLEVIGDGVQIPSYSGKMVTISKPGTKPEEMTPENTRILWMIVPNNPDVKDTEHLATYLVSPQEFVKRMGWKNVLADVPAREQFLAQKAPKVEWVEGGAKVDGEFIANHVPKRYGTAQHPKPATKVTEVKGGIMFGEEFIPVTKSGPPWRSEPASAKQLDLLKRFGVDVPAGLTKGAASDLLDRILPKKPTVTTAA